MTRVALCALLLAPVWVEHPARAQSTGPPGDVGQITDAFKNLVRAAYAQDTPGQLAICVGPEYFDSQCRSGPVTAAPGLSALNSGAPYTWPDYDLSFGGLEAHVYGDIAYAVCPMPPIVRGSVDEDADQACLAAILLRRDGAWKCRCTLEIEAWSPDRALGADTRELLDQQRDALRSTLYHYFDTMADGSPITWLRFIHVHPSVPLLYFFPGGNEPPRLYARDDFQPRPDVLAPVPTVRLADPRNEFVLAGLRVALVAADVDVSIDGQPTRRMRWVAALWDGNLPGQWGVDVALHSAVPNDKR